MAGPITIKLKQTISFEELVDLVRSGWDSKKYGEPNIQDVNGKRFLGFPGTEWISAIAYPGRKKIIVQAMPGHYTIVYTPDGKEQLKRVNREVVPVVAEGFRELMGDLLK